MSITVTPQDVRFNKLKMGRNGRWPATASQEVGRIVICESADDAAEALQQTVSAGQRPTIRSGGHCYEDFFANNPGGTLIDMGMLDHTGRLPNDPRYRIGAGATLGKVYQDLYRLYNVTLPGGTCASVGAGGHITGGGYGLLSRLQGLTCDWLSEVDILTVDAKGKVVQRRANNKQDADLLRACRGGGGGNFGVITNYVFDKLPPAPEEVIISNLSFPWATMTEEKFAKILDTFGNYSATRGQEPDTWGLSPVMVLNHKMNGHIGISVQFCNPDGTCKDLKVLNEFLDLFNTCEPNTNVSTPTEGMRSRNQPQTACGPRLTRTEWIDTDGGGGVRRRGSSRAKYKSTYMRQNYTPREIKVFYKHLTRMIPGIDLSGSVVEVDTYGGAINRKELATETAAPQRSSIIKMQFQTYWSKPEDDAGHLTWIRDFYTELYSGPDVDSAHQGTPFPNSRYEGCYINYPDEDMLQYDYWTELYYGEAYPFLQQVKQKYDPNNIFHHAMSIRP
ncbi:MAG TPA: BBE domain-containing protein [Edaphobacter sp.]|nr:BBE domain-containing protein [Edaphobacter sp.]